MSKKKYKKRDWNKNKKDITRDGMISIDPRVCVCFCHVNIDSDAKESVRGGVKEISSKYNKINGWFSPLVLRSRLCIFTWQSEVPDVTSNQTGDAAQLSWTQVDVGWPGSE